ncbi:ORC-CDC6 family AAA ATPase [Solemya pervernicosa gill symbiont]
MRASSLYTATNARHLTPEEVAETFIPVPQFIQLTKRSHSILLGPRGCGKTTLLKMLTRPAINSWRNNDGGGSKQIMSPEFEAIYVPSDVRWAQEMLSIEKSKRLDSNNMAVLQRAYVVASLIRAWIDAISYKLNNNKEKQIKVSRALTAMDSEAKAVSPR